MTPTDGLRIDKWLWYARFFKTRAAATNMVQSGKFRLDGQVMSKPHRHVQIGQTLTFAQGHHIRVIQVEQLAVRRGPASEAAALYTDLAPVQERPKKHENKAPTFEMRHAGAGRPTKKHRRETEKLKDGLGS